MRLARTLFIFAALAIALIAAPAAIATSGELDDEFGKNGRVYTVGGLDASWHSAHAATVVAPDGSILVATQRPESTYRPATGRDLEVQLRRYLPNGHIDRDFGKDGVVLV